MQQKKVLFTHGYFLEEDPKEKSIMRSYPPLGILYLSAYLESNGIENNVHRALDQNLNKALE